MFDFLFHNRRERERKKPEEAGANNKHESLKPFGRLADAVKTTVQTVQDLNHGESQKLEKDSNEVLQQIEVVAFVGPSGTGKSTRALNVAREEQIGYIIDDGLLIHGSSVVAGISAKRASTKIDSVRQAIFADETRAQNMRRALAEQQPERLMILGTSQDMLLRICNNLHLREPARWIRIEDISTEAERRMARETRLTQGRHTIPVPSMEIRHEFNGYLAEPLQMLRRRFGRGEKDLPEGERTEVRPTFSTLGSYSISDEAMAQLVRIAVRRVPGVADLHEFTAIKETSGVLLKLSLSLYYGYNAQQVLREAQTFVAAEVERLASINVISADMRAVRVIHLPNRA